MTLDPDERQEWRHTARRIAERAKILHEELVNAGHHQDQCYLMTRYYVQTEIDKLNTTTPQPDVTTMNEILGALKKQFMPNDDDE